jgi:hypothetical protein
MQNAQNILIPKQMEPAKSEGEKTQLVKLNLIPTNESTNTDIQTPTYRH